MVNRKYIILIIAVIIVLLGALYASGIFQTDNETVSIGYLPSDHDSALFVANASGMYKDAGINVELHEYNNGGDLMSAMASGDVDVGYVGVTPALSSISKGVPIKIVAGAQTEGSGLVTAENSGITSVGDLKGKTVATPGEASIQYLLLNYDLKKSGLSINDVESPGMKVASMNDALKTGSIDAMLTYEPYVSIAENQTGANVLQRSGDIIPNHPCCVVVMSDSFLNNHAVLAKEMINIHKEATQKLIDNPTDCVQYLPSNIVPDADLEGSILSNITWVSDLNDTFKQDIRDFMGLEKDLGFLNETLTDDQVFYSG